MIFFILSVILYFQKDMIISGLLFRYKNKQKHSQSPERALRVAVMAT